MPVNSSCWIYWHKDRYGDFADGELAWTSFPTAVRMFKYTWDGFRKESPQDRIHPTEKPYGLYRWLLKNYAKKGDRILDTHGGSMSIAVVCYSMGIELDLCELDKDYFEAGQKRLDEYIAKNAPASEVPATKKGELKLF